LPVTLTNFLNSFVTFFLPPRCSICLKDTASFLCEECQCKLDFQLQKATIYGCEHLFFTFYSEAFKQLMFALKFRGELVGVDKFFDTFQLYLQGQDFLNQYDIWVPVPYHPLRLYKRGFNVLDKLFLKGLSDYGIEQKLLLKRKFFTKPLYNLSKMQRHQQLVTSFVVNQDDSLDYSKLRVLLVDDIVTTQSTMKACISTLNSFYRFKSLTCLSLIKVKFDDN